MDQYKDPGNKKEHSDQKSWEAEMKRQQAYAEKKAEESAGTKQKDAKEKKKKASREERQRSYRRAPQRPKTQMTVSSVLKSSLLWGLCIFCLLFGMLSAMTPINAYFVISGIDMIVLSVLACPFVTRKTREWPSLQGFYRYKRWIVAALVIFTLLSMYLAGSFLT